MSARTLHLGYVAAMPNSEVNRGINAFTLGVRRVNPSAKVVVMWTGAWQNEEKEAINAERLIREKNADVITYHQDEDAACRAAEKSGVDFIGYNALLTGYSPHYLTSILCQWEVYYTDIVQRYLKGEINSVKNHWLGIDQNVVKLSEFSAKISPKTAQRIESLKQELLNGKFIFAGELYDNQGVLRCAKDEVIGDDTLLERMDWLIEGAEVFE